MLSFQTAEAQSGGALVITARAGGEPAKADVVVLTASVDPQEVAKGRSGAPMPVPNGSYDVRITCTELLDHPTQELQAVKVSGSQVEREVTFEAGTTTLNVKRGGRPLKGAKMVFKTAAGEELPGHAKTGMPFKMSPGNYEAEIVVGSKRSKSNHTITGIQVYDGAKRNIAVEI